MDTVLRLELPLKLDQPTEGLGNCFPIAIVQQLQRPEIFTELRTSVQRLARHQKGHALLRQSVKSFMMNSRHPRVAAFRAQYEETDGNVDGISWNQYWASMVIDKTWVSYWFVQAAVWYLQLDLWIVATSNTDRDPYIIINGNLADESKPSGGPIITIGTKSNVHYQSLLPIETFHLGLGNNRMMENRNSKHDVNSTNDIQSCKIESDGNQESNDRIEKTTHTKKGGTDVEKENGEVDTKNWFDTKMECWSQHDEVDDKESNTNCEKQTATELIVDSMDMEIGWNRYAPFLFECNGLLFAFLCMSDDFIMKCPMCRTETKQLVQHLSKSQKCKLPGDAKTLMEEFQEYKKMNQSNDLTNNKTMGDKELNESKENNYPGVNNVFEEIEDNVIEEIINPEAITSKPGEIEDKESYTEQTNSDGNEVVEENEKLMINCDENVGVEEKDKLEKQYATEVIVDSKDMEIGWDSYAPFLFECNGTLFAFLCMSDDFIMKCPMLSLIHI